MPALFVSYSAVWGGAERILADLAGALDEPCLACPPGPLAAEAEKRAIRVFPLSARRLELRGSPRDRLVAPLRLAAHAREVRALVTSLRPELVVGWGMRATLAASAALRRLEPRPGFLFHHHDFLPGPVIARAVQAAARRSDMVVCLSESVASELDPDGDLDGRLAVLHAGVDLARFDPAAREPAGPEALVLGAIVRWKRPDLALEAAALAARELPDLRLRLAGPALGADGERLLAELRERAKRPDLSGRVEVAGTVDAPDALSRAGCLLHCADREPFGLALVEALAAGVPVVAPEAGGPAEIVDADCGYLYPPGDPAAAAAALVKLFGDGDRAARMGAAGRERAERRFDLAQTRRRFRELAAEAAPPAPAPERPGEGVALVTVTHDSESELERLLGSVDRHLAGARVVVVDSGSSDRSAEVAQGWRGGAEVIELGRNAGFGAGVNAGVAAIPPDVPVTAVLNPDVELVDGSLAGLAGELARGEGPERILAPLVLLPDGRRQDSAHPEPGSAPLLLSAIVPPAALPGPLRRRVDPWRADRPRRVGWAIGACLIARTATFRRLGPFDEHAFLFAEDLHLGLRAADAGVETWFRPDARVVHRSAHATSRYFGGEPFELLARRRREVVAERRGPRRRRLDDWLQLATFADRVVLKTIARRPAERERRQLDALRRARRERGAA